MVTKEKPHVFLKDNVANQIFRDEKCREYVICIISSALDIPKEFLREHLKVKDGRLNNSITVKAQEVDGLFETDTMIIDLEVNKWKHQRTFIKNDRYVFTLYLEQLPPGKDYIFSDKKVCQINLNDYDMFGKGEFIYHSSIMEERFHLKRNDFIHIVDISIPILEKMSYTDIEALCDNDLRWLLYIFVQNNTELESTLYKENAMMKVVCDKMNDLQKALMESLYYDREEWNRETGILVAKDEARAEGLAEGRAEGRAAGLAAGLAEGHAQGMTEGQAIGAKEKQLEIAKEMLKENYDITQILKITKLSSEDIQKLQEELLES